MPDPVGDAVNTIKDNLSESWRDWDVSHGDLTENSQVLASLTPEERNEVIGQLGDGDLDKWADEIHGTIGDLSASERQSLFNSLADGLDAEQLARVTAAFEGHDGSVAELGRAIAERAPATVRVEYVERMAAQTDSGDTLQIDAGLGYASSTQADPQAIAVGEVLASLSDDPASFDRAVAALNDSQLSSVLESAAGGSLTTVSGGHGASATTVDYDPGLLADIVTAAARSDDAATKARVFEVAAGQLQDIQDAGGLFTPYVGQSDDVAAVSDALGTLLDSDPNGIVTQLRTNADPSGQAMVSYTAGLLASGQEDRVRDTIVRLQQGNDGSGNAYDAFQDPVVSRNLGYFTGATAAAINNVTSDREAQADMVKNVFGTGFGAAGAANPAAGVIASVGNGITAQTIDSIVSAVAEGDKELKQALYELGIPRDASGAINDDGPGYDSYNAAFAAVAEANR
ncbi:hypothetical protein [Luteimonas kalidii]|uniref:DUF1217 domain-containing protein n=1 Tax=Luteimonas kalidii TaxID=3042025 RepID=A0ABT6JPT7_9GAMM|nr:hypothetical protein [Luteimonas kalidii]MDH5832699.1 hypothetical protein [Luteimonas kalidii]